MRAISTSLEAVYGLRNRAAWWRVWISLDGVTWYDMSNHFSRDWQISASITESVDAIGMSASVTLSLRDYEYSLSPYAFNSPSFVPRVVFPGNEVYIEVATVAQDQVPGDDDWVERFRGEIDSFQIGTDTISFSCRDQIGLLVDTVMETNEVYGSGAGTDIEDVIQDILDDHLGVGVVTLYSENGTGGTPFLPGDSPGFALLEWTQRKTSVYSACKDLAVQIGWEFRYKWNPNVDEYVLTLYEPRRIIAVADRSFDSESYDADLSFDRQNLRNVIAGCYFDADGTKSAKLTKTDASSVGQFGRRYMELNEAVGSQIDTTPELDDMLDAALDDAATPNLVMAITMEVFWPVEVGDYYTFEAQPGIWDTDQTLAVQSYKQDYSQKGAMTSMEVTGKPSIGQARWQSMQALPGYNNENPFVAPPAAQNITVVGSLSGLVIEYDDPWTYEPPVTDWKHTECHVSDAGSGFTPSSSTLRGKGRQTRFEVGSLTPGTEYHVKLIIFDNHGVKGTTSSASGATTEWVDAFTTNNDTVPSSNEVPNGDFGAWPGSGL